MPGKSTVYSCVRKLEKTGTSQDETGRLRQQMADAATADLCQVGAVSQKIFAKIVPSTLLLLAYLSKSCQKKAKLRQHRVTTVRQLEQDKQKQLRYCQRLQDFLHNSPRMLDISDSICMVRWIQRILGYELPEILTLFAKNYDIRK